MSLDSFFKIKESGSSVRAELLGGFTTFVSMAYICVTVPSLLAECGVPLVGSTVATTLCAAISSVLMGLWVNLPVGIAAGLGLPSVVACTVCGTMGYPWQIGLGVVFLGGVLFFLMSVTRAGRIIANSIPPDLKIAMSAGIGAFIAFIGLTGCGIVSSAPSSLLHLGDLGTPRPLLGLFGCIFIATLMSRGISVASLVGIAAVTLLGYAVGASELPAQFPGLFSLRGTGAFSTFFELDVLGALNLGLLSTVISFAFTGILGDIGTLLGLARQGKFMNPDGSVRGMERALALDSAATLLHACLGTSLSTCFLESAAGITAGARTGLAAVVTGVCFLLVLPFTPFVSLVPPYATSPVLVIIGILMMQDVCLINFKDLTTALPSVLAVISIPLTGDIAAGMGFSFISYVLLKAATGKASELAPALWGVASLFLVLFAVRPN